MEKQRRERLTVTLEELRADIERQVKHVFYFSAVSLFVSPYSVWSLLCVS